MLTIAKLGQWAVSYYVDTARQAAASALDGRAAGGGLGEYYSESETRLPAWLSAGRNVAEAMGLTGVGRNGETADLDAVTRWLDDGVSPCEASGRAFNKRDGVHGYDLTFCAPKSVSLLRGLGDDVMGKAVAEAHAYAVAEAMEYLAEHGGYTRVHNPRTGQKDLVRLPGIVAATFQHETSRAGDPHLHTHAVVPNRQARADGKLVSLDGTSLYHEARAAGIIYQATLRRELTRLIGIEWGEVDARTGMAEIAGAHRGDLTSWSQRATQLREWASGHLRVECDELSAGQLATAQKATRPRKPEGVAWAALRGAWAADTRGFRISRPAQQAAREARRLAGVDYADVVRRAVAHGLKQAAFTRADLVEAIGARMPVDDADGLSPREVIERLADDVALRIGDERAAHQREGSIRYTAADLVAEERAIIELMGRRNHAAVLPAVDTVVLSPDQAKAVTAIATSEWLVQPLSAPAGAGKTHSLRALRAAAHQAGKRVLVAAPTGRAVDVAVREEAGDLGATLDALLGRLERGEEVLDADTVIVVDEAGMVGTQHLRQLLETATTAGTKVVLVGDEHQLAPVAQRGGTFAQLVADVPWAQRLSQVWRMHDHDERDASLAVRDGGPAALRRAVGWYRRTGRLHTGDQVTMADDALAAWTADTAAGRDALLLADRWEMADAINMRIHSERIGDDAPTVRAARGHQLAAGDVVITRHNTVDIPTRTDRGVDADPIRNGQRWEVLAVDTGEGRIAVRRLDDGAIAALSGDYLRQYVHLGYAVTVHAAQGVTADTCHALLSAEAATRSIAYVGLTRGRQTNTVHLYDTRAGEGDHEHAEIVPGRHTARRGTPGEAAAALRSVLGRGERAATITAAARDADEDRLPEPVADLRRYHRTVSQRLRREHRIERHTAQDRSMHARMHASDRALVEVLGAARRHADPLALPRSRTDPAAVALAAPYVVATMAAERYTPELADTVQQAAASTDRAYIRVAATPSRPDQIRLGQLAERLPDSPPPQGAVMVVEDAATANPAHLAAVATALVPAHGRLLLVDSGEQGNARRLLDGLALPWNEKAFPAMSIDDPALAAAADRHRAEAARSWRIRINPPARDRSRDRDRGHGLGID
ncbi:MobF family relaxase [Mycolicibacterium iranicum]|uniref:AAA family ATPase n=1 Tax=Mycolicibacterium iranicum TaxID=912594 RepID=A0A178LLY3_MYCIR|nr:MobF family relaxase [Mycolicibacterium iranicum]OAN31245.1 AAA family ATPase [Mycolicibacterium iranicum]